MSRVIDLCEDGDDNAEWPNTASIPSIPLSRKRPRDKEELESFNENHPHDEKGPKDKDKNATGSAKFIVDLEHEDVVKLVFPHSKKRCSVMNSERCIKNDAAGKCAQSLKVVETTEKVVHFEDAQIVGRHESYEGIDEAQASQNDGCVKCSKKLLTSKPASKASERQCGVSTCEDRLSELADYRKINGHCNVPQKCSENSKLGSWVSIQRQQYKLHREGKPSPMTAFRIQELESLGFEWKLSRVCVTAWEARLSELADYRKIHGHCNVPQNYSKNTKLANWVMTQRKQYRLRLAEKSSQMTPFRIQELESLGFEWGVLVAAWENRLSELAKYRKIHGHCNVPQNYSKNIKLASWVATQRKQYMLHVKGKSSQITLPRTQALESLDFQWKPLISRRKRTPDKRSLDEDATRVREWAVEAPEHKQQNSLKKIAAVEKSTTTKSTSHSNPNNPTVFMGNSRQIRCAWKQERHESKKRILPACLRR